MPGRPEGGQASVRGREAVCRIPDFAGQCVRQASVVAEVVGGTPTRLVRCTFAILEINGEGLLDVERWNLQQFARVRDPFEPGRPVHGTESPVVHAADRFIARGGAWEPDHSLMRRIEATALGRRACQRVRVVRGTSRRHSRSRTCRVQPA